MFLRSDEHACTVDTALHRVPLFGIHPITRHAGVHPTIDDIHKRARRLSAARPSPDHQACMYSTNRV